MTTNELHNPRMGVAIHPIRLQRGLAFGLIIVIALLAFELFNYSTTDYALSNLLGDLKFVAVKWSTILAIAFCGIDFAGIARLFTPEEGRNEPHEVWYLFGAWLLAATMNAMLTWWGVSLAIANHNTLGNSVIPRDVLLRVVPVFTAIMVWLIRVLIIGTFSVAGDRLFSQRDYQVKIESRPALRMIATPPPGRPLGNINQAAMPRINATPANNQKAIPPRMVEQADTGYNRQELTYTPVHMSPAQSNGRSLNAQNTTRNGYPKNRQNM